MNMFNPKLLDTISRMFLADICFLPPGGDLDLNLESSVLQFFLLNSLSGVFKHSFC